MAAIKKAVIILLILRLSANTLQARNFSVDAEMGLGNLFSAYLLYSLSAGHSVGCGCGYLYYQDDEEEITLNILSPAILYSASLHDLFIIRARFSIDYVSKNQMSYIKKSYTLSPDLLVKAVKFNSGSIYAGISLPVVIGNTTGIDTLIGAGYNFNF